MDWNNIQDRLADLDPVKGGFSSAIRGTMTLPTGQQIFVKAGNDKNTRDWAHKEIAVYRFLSNHSYSHIGELIAVNEDETAFAIEALTKEYCWDWSETWTTKRLDATLAAMDELAAIRPKDTNATIFKGLLSKDDDGWVEIANSNELQSAFRSRMGDNPTLHRIAESFGQQAEVSRSFDAMSADALIHLDVRADNCAWNAEKNIVKLVDWNWLSLGNRGIDLASFLVHVYDSGLDILPDYAERLDPSAVHWMAGFWIKSGCTPIWPGGPANLRDIQFKKGTTALELLDKIR